MLCLGDLIWPWETGAMHLSRTPGLFGELHVAHLFIFLFILVFCVLFLFFLSSFCVLSLVTPRPIPFIHLDGEQRIYPRFTDWCVVSNVSCISGLSMSGIVRTKLVTCIDLCFYRVDTYQAQASEQFLASNKAICLKTKKINRSNMYF